MTMRDKRMILAVFLFIVADSSGGTISGETISQELQREINRFHPAPEEMMTETLGTTTPVLPAATTDLLAQELQTEIIADHRGPVRKPHKAKAKEAASKTKLIKKEKMLKQKLVAQRKIAAKKLSTKLAAQKLRQQKALREQKIKSNLKLAKLKQRNKMVLAKAKSKAMSARAHEKTSKTTAKVKSDMQLKLRVAKIAAAKKAATAARAAALRHKQSLLRVKTRMAREGSAKKAKTSQEKAGKHSSITQLKAKLDKATSTLRTRLRKQRSHTAGARTLKRRQRRSVRKVRRMARAAHRAAKRKSRRLKRKMRRMQGNADATIRKKGRSDTNALRKLHVVARKQVHQGPPTTVILEVKAGRPGTQKIAAKKHSSKSQSGRRPVQGALQHVVRKRFTVPKLALPKSVRHAYEQLKKKEEKVSREEDALLSPFTASYDRLIVDDVDQSADELHELQEEIDGDIDNISDKTAPTAGAAAVPIRLQGGQVKNAPPKAKHSGAGRIDTAGVWLPFLLVLATVAARH